MYFKQPQTPAIAADRWRRRSLRAVYLPESVTPRDLSGNGRHVTDTTSTLGMDMNGPGRCWNTSGATAATSRIRLPNASLNALNGVTWISVVYATSVTDCTIAHTDTNEGGTGDAGLSMRVNSGAVQALYPGIAVLAVGPTISTGRWYTLGMRIKCGTGIVANFSVDGTITDGTSLDTSTPSNAPTATPSIGCQSPSTRLWAGRIALFAAFDTMLTDGEFASLTRNPWQLFVDPIENRTRNFTESYLAAAPAGGHPTMRRWGGVPGMTPGPQSFGRGW